MKYVIEFFDEDVQQAVLSWPTGINASFTRIALRMVEHGANLGLPYTRAMGGGLFEIRAKGQEGDQTWLNRTTPYRSTRRHTSPNR